MGDKTSYVTLNKVRDYKIPSFETINVGYEVTGIFGENNVFTVELSDSSGSFSMPVEIGSIASEFSGTIHCTAPFVPCGKEYKLRITSTNPPEISDPANSTITILGECVPPTNIAYDLSLAWKHALFPGIHCPVRNNMQPSFIY